MYYAIYKGIRNSAWQCLIDFGIDRFPVDILKIARTAGVKIVKNSLVDDLDPSEYGKSYYDGTKWIIIYDDTNDIVTSRFTIAHELGHIFLGHAMTHAKYCNIREFGKKPRSEQQADMFAIRLLCPACVLKDMNISSAKDLASICRIPLPWAEIRYSRLKELNKRNKYFTDPLEIEVYNKFTGILSQKSTQN